VKDHSNVSPHTATDKPAREPSLDQPSRVHQPAKAQNTKKQFVVKVRKLPEDGSMTRLSRCDGLGDTRGSHLTDLVIRDRV